ELQSRNRACGRGRKHGLHGRSGQRPKKNEQRRYEQKQEEAACHGDTFFLLGRRNRETSGCYRQSRGNSVAAGKDICDEAAGGARGLPRKDALRSEGASPRGTPRTSG